MPGIERIGVHIPRSRLARADLASHWGGGARPGTRAVANWDEDVVTMAVEAASQCLAGRDTDAIDAVLVASTTHPYLEKQSAAVVAEALDLRDDVLTIDLGSSLRAGVDGVRLALDLVGSGAQREVLVVAADTRPAAPGSREEQAFGDAAVAVLVGGAGALARVEPLAVGYSGATGVWRRAGDPYVQSGDPRFVNGPFLERELSSVLVAAVGNGGLGRVDGVVLGDTGSGARRALAAAGIERAPQAGRRVGEAVGATGTAAPWLAFAEALEAGKEGERWVVAGSGDGADLLACTLGPLVSEHRERAPLAAALANARPLSVGHFQRYRGGLGEPEPVPFTSEMSLWRDHDALIRLRAPQCRGCGAAQYPPRRVCWQCQRKDDFTEIRLGHAGTLYTYTVEHLFPVPEGRLVMAVLDLEGVRMYTQLTDADDGEIELGMPVRLTLRRLHTGGGFNHYFWKARP